MATAYLCMRSKWSRKDGNPPTFLGYSIYSTAPWNLTNTGELNSIIYQADGDSFQEAHNHLLEIVKHFASMMPFWAHVWEHIDPSEEGLLPEKDDEQA